MRVGAVVLHASRSVRASRLVGASRIHYIGRGVVGNKDKMQNARGESQTKEWSMHSLTGKQLSLIFTRRARRSDRDRES